MNDVQILLVEDNDGDIILTQEALKEGKIAGAGLDVFEFEPKVTPGLTKLGNVILTPHIASASNRARDIMSRTAAENIINFLEGKKVEHECKL